MARIAEKLTAKWQHAANGLFGVWLVASPWVFAFADHRAAALNASMIGLLIALVAASALLAHHEPGAHGAGERGLGKVAPWLTEEWSTAEVGAWLIVSPYLLGFDTMQAASWTHLIVGMLVVVLALWAAISAQYTDRATRSRRRSAPQLAPKERHIKSSNVDRVVSTPPLLRHSSRRLSRTVAGRRRSHLSAPDNGGVLARPTRPRRA
jgi:hypothetical protein